MSGDRLLFPALFKCLPRKTMNTKRGIGTFVGNATPLYGLYGYMGAKGYGLLAVLSEIRYYCALEI